MRAEFLFDLASPFTYLAAERVDRAFDEVTWTPACARTLRCARAAGRLRRGRRPIIDTAEERAAALRLPLEWPERWPMPVPAAMRVAHYAAQQGRGAAFVLAATRLAFAGGFDLDDLEILTEAAAAAGLRLDRCLQRRARGAPRRRDGGGVPPPARRGRRPAAGAVRSPAACSGARIASATRPRPRACTPPPPRVSGIASALAEHRLSAGARD